MRQDITPFLVFLCFSLGPPRTWNLHKDPDRGSNVIGICLLIFQRGLFGISLNYIAFRCRRPTSSHTVSGCWILVKLVPRHWAISLTPNMWFPAVGSQGRPDTRPSHHAFPVSVPATARLTSTAREKACGMMYAERHAIKGRFDIHVVVKAHLPLRQPTAPSQSMKYRLGKYFFRY